MISLFFLTLLLAGVVADPHCQARCLIRAGKYYQEDMVPYYCHYACQVTDLDIDRALSTIRCLKLMKSSPPELTRSQLEMEIASCVFETIRSTDHFYWFVKQCLNVIVGIVTMATVWACVDKYRRSR